MFCLIMKSEKIIRVNSEFSLSSILTNNLSE